MATKIITRNAAGFVPGLSTGADYNKGSSLTAVEHDQNLVNLRAAVDNALAGTQASLSNTIPLMDSVSSQAGTAVTTSRSDHVHPQDILKEDAQAVGVGWQNTSSPYVKTAALVGSTFTNKLKFIVPSLIESKASTANDATWISHQTILPSSDPVKAMMIGNGNYSTVSCPSGKDIRFTWTNSGGLPGYVHLSYLYLLWVAGSSTAKVKIEYFHTVWTTIADTAYMNGWPAHVTVPHNLITYFDGDKLRITLNIQWTGVDPFIVHSLEWLGAYPAVPKEIYTIDFNKGVTFPASVNSPNIYTTSNVGIGTNTPNDLLHVYGASKSIALTDTAITNPLYNTVKIFPATQNTFGIGVASASTYASQLYLNGLTGNTGVGTNNPTNQLTVLDVGQSTNAQLKLQNIANSTSFSYLGNWSNGLYLSNGGYYKSGPGYVYDSSSYMSLITVFGTPSDSYVSFHTAPTASTTPTSRMHIDKNGLVGIGNTIPFANLSLGVQTSSPGPAPINLSLGGSYSSVAGSNLKLKLWDNGSPSINYGIGISDSQMDYVVGSIARHAWWANGAQLMTLLSSGNLGLGVITPLYKLHVNGDFVATTKSFLIDHPTKPDMKLRHGSLEGPENGVYVRGKLSKNHIINLPEYWDGLVDRDTITVNLTPIGRHQELYIESINEDHIIVGSNNHIIDCFYTVYAERKDVEKLIVEF